MTHAMSAFPAQTRMVYLMSPPTQATNIAKVTFLTFRINGSRLVPDLVRNTLDPCTIIACLWAAWRPKSTPSGPRLMVMREPIFSLGSGCCSVWAMGVVHHDGVPPRFSRLSESRPMHSGPLACSTDLALQSPFSRWYSLRLGLDNLFATSPCVATPSSVLAVYLDSPFGTPPPSSSPRFYLTFSTYTSSDLALPTVASSPSLSRRSRDRFGPSLAT